MTKTTHHAVIHPSNLLAPAKNRFARFNDWAVDHLAIALGSSIGVWLAFIVPLFAFGLPALLVLVGLISSYWIQLWALFVLQKSSNKAAAQASVKADADHMAMTHIATVADAILAKLEETPAQQE